MGNHARTCPTEWYGLNAFTEAEGFAGAQHRSHPQYAYITTDADVSASLFQQHISILLQNLSFCSSVLTSTELGPLPGNALGAGDTETGQSLHPFSGSQTPAGRRTQ